MILLSYHALYFFAVAAMAVYFTVYLLTRPRARRLTTQSIAVYFAIIGLWAFAWVVFLGVLHPWGAWASVALSLFTFAPAFWIRFAYHYPVSMRTWEGRWIPALVLAAATISFGWSVFEGFGSEIYFDPQWGVYRMRDLARSNMVSGALQFLSMLWALVVFLRRIGKFAGIRRRGLRAFAWITAFQLSLVVAYLAYLAGALGVDAYRFVLTMGCMLIALITYDAYFNNAPISSTLRSKLSALSLAILFFIICALYFWISPDYARMQDRRVEEAISAVRDWQPGDSLPDRGPDYLRYLDGSNRRFARGGVEAPLAPFSHCERDGYCWNAIDWLNPGSLYLVGIARCDQSCAPGAGCEPIFCEAGLRYSSLREEFEHRPTIKFSLALLLAAVGALIVTPLFYRRGVLSPLERLLEGFRRVDRGELNVHIPVSVRDEIGKLTGSFNGMVASIRDARRQLESYAARLEEMVQAKTAELQRTIDDIRRDLNLARRIQEQTLPDAPVDDERIRFVVRYLPQAQVGGDLYDICRLRPDCYRIFLADATGHGVRAALITMAIKTEYESLKRSISDPQALMAALNQQYRRKFAPLGAFFTCVIVDIDLNRMQAQYVSAGHPVQLHLRKAEAMPIEKTGIIVGVHFDAAYEVRTLELRTGDRLLLYSDGLFEQFNQSRELLGEQRVASEAVALAGASLERLADGLLEQVQRHAAGQAREDDISLVAIELRSGQV